MSRLVAADRRGQLSRALGAVLAAVIAVALSPAASTAHADTPDVNRGAETEATEVAHGAPAQEATAFEDREAAASDVIAPAYNVVFDRPLTNGMWYAAAASRTALATYCQVSVPGFLRPACHYIAESSLYTQLVRMGPPNGRCLKVTPRFGIPPYRLSYTTCP